MPDNISGKIIITRDEKKAAPLMASLKEKGIMSYAVPVTRIVYDLSKKLPSDFNDHNWIAFTSANGVHALAENLEKEGFVLNDNLQIAAVGSTTAMEIEKKP
jgi:uroporphyrinogen-III synthase